MDKKARAFGQRVRRKKIGLGPEWSKKTTRQQFIGEKEGRTGTLMERGNRSAGDQNSRETFTIKKREEKEGHGHRLQG